MSVALADKTELRIPAPELRGAVLELAKYPEMEQGVDGPAGTGKTYGIMYFIHVLLSSFPRAKWLVARKFNIDLAGSALALYRESILDDREGVRYFGGNKVRPAAYLYPNGSEMIVNGLDRSSKVKSMDFDGIYICEATDCELEDIEMCHIRLARRKNSALPERFQKLIMDFNPDAPTHFLNQRMNEGRTRRLLSRHEDNPFLWDNRTQDWTEAGRRYIRELDTLTGVRYARYRLGLWVAAEGTVYEDSWDRARNVIDRFPIPREWPRYLAVDFGYTNPFVCAWWAMDPDGRLFCYREIYHTKRLVEDHAKQIRHYSQWGKEGGDPLPREVICDHDAEDRATLERHLGLITRPAHKSVRDGIQAMAARLRPAGDGKPRLMYFRDALVERDMELSRQKKPTCTIEEPESYVWAENQNGIKEEPVKENDHGCLVAGTMVKTIRGDVPIEQIAAGDYVLTRNGYKPVIAAGMTAQSAEVFTAHFSNGATLTGTGNHPIYLIGQGYTPLRAMRYGDIIEDVKHYRKRHLLWEKIRVNQKSSTTKELHSDGIQRQRIGQTRVTTALMPITLKQELRLFTLKSGKMLMDLYQKGMKFTTKTVIHPIMYWTIWNALHQKRTLNIMLSIFQRNEGLGQKRILRRYALLHQHGTDQTQGEHGIANLRTWPGKMLNSLPETAKTVARNLSTLALEVSQSIALTSVRPRLATNQASITSNVSAQSAEMHSRSTSIAVSNPALVHVLSVCEEAERQAVYNLVVENPVGEGEYFANGVLVHNCDQSRYIVARFDLKPTTIRYSSRVY